MLFVFNEYNYLYIYIVLYYYCYQLFRLYRQMMFYIFDIAIKVICFTFNIVLG